MKPDKEGRPLTMIEEADRDHPEAMARARAEVAAEADAERSGRVVQPVMPAKNATTRWQT